MPWRSNSRARDGSVTHGAATASASAASAAASQRDTSVQRRAWKGSSNKASAKYQGVSSKIVEDGFNCCRDRIRHDKQGNISRVTRTHRVQSSTLLEDTDRARLPVETLAKMVAPTFLPSAAFAATSRGNFSLPDDSLKEYMDGKTALAPCPLF